MGHYFKPLFCSYSGANTQIFVYILLLPVLTFFSPRYKSVNNLLGRVYTILSTVNLILTHWKPWETLSSVILCYIHS